MSKLQTRTSEQCMRYVPQLRAMLTDDCLLPANGEKYIWMAAHTQLEGLPLALALPRVQPPLTKYHELESVLHSLVVWADSRMGDWRLPPHSSYFSAHFSGGKTPPTPVICAQTARLEI
jgi:hypothetical protein